MDIVIDIFDGLSLLVDTVIDLISPFFLEIVVGIFMLTFILGLIQSHR